MPINSPTQQSVSMQDLCACQFDINASDPRKAHSESTHQTSNKMDKTRLWDSLSNSLHNSSSSVHLAECFLCVPVLPGRRVEIPQRHYCSRKSWLINIRRSEQWQLHIPEKPRIPSSCSNKEKKKSMRYQQIHSCGWSRRLSRPPARSVCSSTHTASRKRTH